MNSLVAALIVLYLAAAVVNLSIAVLVFRRQQHLGSRLFACMMVCFALWAGALGAMLIAPDFSTRIVLLHVANAVRLCVPVTWMIATLCFAQVLREDARNWRLWAICASALPWLLLEVTSPAHPLLYTAATADPTLGWPVLAPGPLFVPLMIYAETLVITGICLVVYTLIRSSPYFRRFLPLIVTSCIGVVAVNLLFMAGIFVIDLSPIIVAALAAPILNLTLGVAPIARPQVISLMRDGVIILNADGLVASMNAAAERMMGVPEKQARGQAVHGLFRSFPALATRAVGISRHTLNLTIGGQPSTLDMQYRPIQKRNSALNGWIIHLRDVTAAEQARRNTLALAVEQRRMEILSSFVSAMAHEFRTPLTVIRTSGYIAARTPVADNRTMQHRRISEQVARMNRLLDQMHTMVRLDSGAAPAHDDVDLNALVQQEIKADLKGHPIELSLDPHLPVMHGDIELIAGALRELLLNAAAYSPPGSAIAVATGIQQGAITLSVTDRGGGPAPDVRERMFERLYRGDPARSTPGIGLGLSIVRAVAESHDGRVEVDVSPKRGTVMRLVFATQAETPAAVTVGAR